MSASTFACTGIGTAIFVVIVPDLNNAPIVRVSPMGGDEATEVIANNIREFLSVIAIDSTFIYMTFESEEAYQNYLQEEEASQSEWASTEEDQANRRKVMSRLVDALNLPKIDHPYAYVDQVKSEREKRIVVATPDGLGVTNVHPGEKVGNTKYFWWMMIWKPKKCRAIWSTLPMPVNWHWHVHLTQRASIARKSKR